MILTGDVGGTKTLLALRSEVNGKIVEHEFEKFLSKDFESLEEIVAGFIKDCKAKIQRACIGVPGPVINGKSHSTNLPWLIEEKVVSQRLSIPKFRLTNDLVATAYAIPHFTNEDVLTIYKGDGKYKSDTNIILAPGTGLGQSILHYKNGNYKVLPSEGGHVDFAPRTEMEIELLKYLKGKYENVSYERIVSGQGLVDIFNFLKDTGYDKIEKDVLIKFESEDPAAVISKAALSKKCKVCVKTLDIFVSVLGAQAGNMVLNLVATGGVYLGGGIPPKIKDKLIDGTFIKAFLDKEPVGYLAKSTSVHVIKDDLAALNGATYMALSL